MKLELLFTIAVTFSLFAISCHLVYLNLFVPKKVKQELRKGNYLKAFDYCYMTKNGPKLAEIYRLIELDYKRLAKKIRSKKAKRGDLKRIIKYFPVMDVEYDLFLRTVELLFEMKDQKLINALIRNIEKPAWRKILKEDLKRLKNAE